MDEVQIAALLYRYARAVDTKDWELYRSVFTGYYHHDLVSTPDGSRSRQLASRRSGNAHLILPA